MSDQYDIPLQEVAIKPFTIGERLAAFAAATLRNKADKPRHELARRAYLAAQTFPNDRFIRQPRREEKPIQPNTPEVNRRLLALAYSNGPKPIIVPRKPSRREAIIKRRIAEKDLRHTFVADHPLGVREAAAKRNPRETVRIRGQRCKVAIAHMATNEIMNAKRKRMPIDLSPNAVAERKSRGLTALGRSQSQTVPV